MKRISENENERLEIIKKMNYILHLTKDISFFVESTNNIKIINKFSNIFNEIVKYKCSLKRKAEYILGRNCIQEVFKKMNIKREDYFHSIFYKKKSGEVNWPNEVVGSLSHTNLSVIAIVGKTSIFNGIGIDIENRRRVKKIIWKKLFSKIEIKKLKKLSSTKNQSEHSTLLFSIKESFYKFWFSTKKEKINFKKIKIKFINNNQYKIELILKKEINILDKLKGFFFFTKKQVISFLYEKKSIN
jgi:phosphopantetheine--protein transferase-like protein